MGLYVKIGCLQKKQEYIMINTLSKIFGVIIRFFVSLFPRDKHLIVYGGAMDLFIDNAKHIFIYHNENFYEGYRHVWMSKNKKTIQIVSGLGFNVVRTDSLHGLYTLLRAGFIIFDNCIDAFAYHNLSMGAIRICLWHGAGFKMSDNAVSDNQLPYQTRGWFYEKYLAKHIHGDYFFSPCNMQSRLYSFSFLIPLDHIIIGGYHRTRCFFMTAEERMKYISQYESEEFVSCYNKIEKTNSRRVIYMPTFRDSNCNYINDAIPDWNILNEYLCNSNTIMYLKVHRVTPTPRDKQFSNIVILDGSMDIYPMLPLFDLLITDYSSIMSDFALMKKPILLYTFDLEEYRTNSRNIHENYWIIYNQLPKVDDFEKLCNYLGKSFFQYVSSDLEYYFEKPKDFEEVTKFITILDSSKNANE